MDEIESSATSIMTKEISTAMNKMFEVMAFVCCIYDGDFRNLVRDHELGGREYINGKVDTMLWRSSYNMQRNLNTESSEHDTLAARNLREMVKMLESVVRSGADSHVFCS